MPLPLRSHGNPDWVLLTVTALQTLDVKAFSSPTLVVDRDELAKGWPARGRNHGHGTAHGLGAAAGHISAAEGIEPLRASRLGHQHPEQPVSLELARLAMAGEQVRTLAGGGGTEA